MNASKYRLTSAELNELVQMLDDVPFSSEQETKILECIQQLDSCLSSNFRSLRYLTNSLNEMKRLVKFLLFDLQATRRERDALKKSQKYE